MSLKPIPSPLHSISIETQKVEFTCRLPPAQDGTIAIPADHVLVVGAMGLPEGVPLIVPMSESFDSFQEINTQFEMSPITWPPMGLAENMNDVSIVDASSIGFLDVPAEDHVAAFLIAIMLIKYSIISRPSRPPRPPKPPLQRLPRSEGAHRKLLVCPGMLSAVVTRLRAQVFL
ncbi:hypothetical protein AK812_SmicGene17881 [Symbiodinium microadriaticum]|uniref:Uncharacterized protein n=1 Tax=Symbiodinium microadriaticum TaxID=2951 RepID=A0A1Q9DWM9_SYMMI|nr:hypothetical protein AK812_SmicGene17881 [Symbiodinium microadriaticum]